MANNEQNIVANFHQDFVTGTHNDYFDEREITSLFHWPNHYRETRLSKQYEEVPVVEHSTRHLEVKGSNPSTFRESTSTKNPRLLNSLSIYFPAKIQN
jgi:hypothetical protein